MTPKSIQKELNEIIHQKKIKTVFQPILNLKTGEILGYEALSRGPADSVFKNPRALFSLARENKVLFELETVCRENALYQARNLPEQYKLFINIDPHVIYDQEFHGGVTKKYLKKVNLKQDRIVIELTENTSIGNYEGFKQALSHYRKQGYSVAIDDVGAGYSGLQTIVSISYNYIKIDRSIIEDIHNDEVKQTLIKVLIDFADKINFKIIAEGIETYQEFVKVVELGVDFGQGYFIASPENYFNEDIKISDELDNILNRFRSYYNGNGIIEKLTYGIVNKSVKPDTKVEKVVEIFEKNDNLQSVVVISDKNPIGLVMRDKLYYRLGTKFGYSVFMERPIKLIMDDKPIIVKADDSISCVSEKAMARKQANIYDNIIVTRDGEYLGIVSIKDLLEGFSMLQIEKAKHLNPLTNLPGNQAIEKEISSRLEKKEIFSVLYIDLDNFKVYNDNYGYKKGDRVISFTAGVLKRAVADLGNNTDFVGHIGGDDFVIVTTPEKELKLSKFIINSFDSGIVEFLSDKDNRFGFIKGKNRQGEEYRFPITSISIAIVSNEERVFKNHIQISDTAVEVKKIAKSKQGSAFLKDRRGKQGIME